jgi:hypothetical protein
MVKPRFVLVEIYFYSAVKALEILYSITLKKICHFKKVSIFLSLFSHEEDLQRKSKRET